MLTAFEGTKNGELVMDVDLLEAFDDEADQGYYEDETVSVEELQDIVDQTGRFSGGNAVRETSGPSGFALGRWSRLVFAG